MLGGRLQLRSPAEIGDPVAGFPGGKRLEHTTDTHGTTELTFAVSTCSAGSSTRAWPTSPTVGATYSASPTP